MDLELKRNHFTEQGVFGELRRCDTDAIIAQTLEHSYDGKPKLPDGTYTCVRGRHALPDGPTFDTFEISGVPGHTGILFHAGNFNKDSHGCVLLGEIATRDMLLRSRVAFDDFLAIQADCDSFQLVVSSQT